MICNRLDFIKAEKKGREYKVELTEKGNEIYKHLKEISNILKEITNIIGIKEVI